MTADTWILALDGLPDEDQARRLRQDLPDTEWQWIQRLHQPADRLRSLTGRALARRLLGTRLGLAPKRILLASGSHGKPVLADPAAAWHFNIAHSDDQVLVGIARQPLGVDVETVPGQIDASLWRFVTGRHAALIGPSLDAPETPLDHRAFCVEWVCREAILKACGLGLSIAPAQLCLRPGHEGWLEVEGHPAAQGLCVRLLWQSSQHCAALCLPHPPEHWQLEILEAVHLEK